MKILQIDIVGIIKMKYSLLSRKQGEKLYTMSMMYRKQETVIHYYYLITIF